MLSTLHALLGPVDSGGDTDGVGGSGATAEEGWGGKAEAKVTHRGSSCAVCLDTPRGHPEVSEYVGTSIEINTCLFQSSFLLQLFSVSLNLHISHLL